MRSTVSKNHRNRKAHNWIAYDTGDRLLQQYSHHYKGKTIDLGCGEKPFEEYFLRFVDCYIGVDWSNTQHNLKADIIADLNKPLPIDSEVADTVVSFSVLEHLCEPQNMLSEAYRILKPGGVIVLVCPFQWLVHEPPHDYFRYTPFGLKYMFEKAGFSNIEVTPQSGFFTMCVLKLNYFSLRLVRGPHAIEWLMRMLLSPMWYLGQALAPYLDKLDTNWCSEASAYWTVARKG